MGEAIAEDDLERRIANAAKALFAAKQRMKKSRSAGLEKLDRLGVQVTKADLNLSNHRRLEMNLPTVSTTDETIEMSGDPNTQLEPGDSTLHVATAIDVAFETSQRDASDAERKSAGQELLTQMKRRYKEVADAAGIYENLRSSRPDAVGEKSTPPPTASNLTKVYRNAEKCCDDQVLGLADHSREQHTSQQDEFSARVAQVHDDAHEVTSDSVHLIHTKLFQREMAELKLSEEEEIAKEFPGFQALQGCPIICQNEEIDCWLQFRCYICGSNVARPLSYFKGARGIASHLFKAANHLEYLEFLGLDLLTFVMIACVEDVLPTNLVDEIRSRPSIIEKYRNFWADDGWWCDVQKYNLQMSNSEFEDTLYSNRFVVRFEVPDPGPCASTRKRRHDEISSDNTNATENVSSKAELGKTERRFLLWPTVLRGPHGCYDIRCRFCGCNSEDGIWIEGVKGFFSHIKRLHRDKVADDSLWQINPRGWLLQNCRVQQWTDIEVLDCQVSVPMVKAIENYEPIDPIDSDHRKRFTEAGKVTKEMKEAINARFRALDRQVARREKRRQLELAKEKKLKLAKEKQLNNTKEPERLVIGDQTTTAEPDNKVLNETDDVNSPILKREMTVDLVSRVSSETKSVLSSDTKPVILLEN